MYSEAQRKATDRYKKKNYVYIRLSLNKKFDQDIIEKLSTIENKNAYLKELIRKD